jgi:hypothetical protein
MLLISPRSSRSSRRLQAPQALCIALLIAAAAGLGGLGNGLWAAGSRLYVVLCLHNERVENAKLMKTIGFLRSFADDYSNRIARLVGFEDQTRLRFGMNIISSDVRKAGVGGPPSIEEIVLASLNDPNVVRTDIVRERIASLERQLELQKSTFSRMMNQVVRRYDYMAQCPSIWPVMGGRITSPFGSRTDPFFEQRAFHEGIDIANAIWTPVYATADGIASFVGVKGSFGNTIVIEHQNSDYETLYGHLQQTAVVSGQPVRRGELIGYLGTSGRSTGPHLHYEVHKLKRPANPMDFILPTDAMVD